MEFAIVTEILNEQPEQVLPTIEDIACTCESLVTGIRMCLKRIAGDDIFKRRLEGMIDEIGQLEIDFVNLQNQNTRECNDLIDECEGLQSANGLLNLRVQELEGELNMAAQATAAMLDSERAAHHRKRLELEGELTQMAQNVTVLESTAKLLVSEKRMQKNKLDEYERMQPQRLKDQNAKLKIANAELTKTNSNLNLELTRLHKAHSRLQTDLAKSESHAAELSADLDDYQHFDDLISGEHVVEKFCMVSKSNSLIAFYPYIFKWGLNVWEGDTMMEPKRRNPADLMFIQGLDFHIQIRSTIGVDLTCKMSEFGRALYLLPDALKEHWPDGMDEAIQDYHLEQLERLSPELAERVNWCREQHINTLDFVPEKFKPALVAMKLTNLSMLGAATYEECKHIKGMGMATFTKIREGCIAMLDGYAAEHGVIPLTIQRQHTKPPLAKRIMDGIAPRLAEIKQRAKSAALEGAA